MPPDATPSSTREQDLMARYRSLTTEGERDQFIKDHYEELSDLSQGEIITDALLNAFRKEVEEREAEIARKEELLETLQRAEALKQKYDAELKPRLASPPPWSLKEDTPYGWIAGSLICITPIFFILCLVWRAASLPSDGMYAFATFGLYVYARENITRDTWEPPRLLRTHNANDARHIPENRGILPENILSYLRTAPPAHAR